MCEAQLSCDCALQIHKVYLIAVQTVGDDEDEDGYRAGFRLDLDTVYVLDHETRTLERCEVERQTENVNENDQILCIRYERALGLFRKMHNQNGCVSLGQPGNRQVTLPGRFCL